MHIQIKHSFIKFGVLLLFATSLLCGCKKGEQGPPGATGSANVKYSDWFTANAYTTTTIFGIKNFSYEKAAADITQPVIDSGIVLVYAKLIGYNVSVWPVNQVAQLPISLTYVSGSTMTDTWSALIAPQKITIRFVNDLNYYSNLAVTHQFRYIIVPGGNKISGRRASDEYKNMSYSQVCNRLQIAE